jgi:uncharacterized membrane protein
VTGRGSQLAALVGLLVLGVMVATPPGPATLVGLVPLSAVFIAGALSAPRWAIATAIVMLPYFAWGVMAILTDPGGRSRAVAFAGLTIAVFLAALDALRRSRMPVSRQPPAPSARREP